MRAQWGRAGAIVGLLVAIFSDLRRRAWWAYRTGGLHVHAPRTTIVAPRPDGRRAYVPEVTATWRAVVDRALSIRRTAIMSSESGEDLPVVWIDAADRPDIADLPRVLASGRSAGDGPPLVGTQWLADRAHRQAVLVITFVEPVSCTWALAFDLPKAAGVLGQIADAGALFVAWEVSGHRHMPDEQPDARIAVLPSNGLAIHISRPAHLRALLSRWREPFHPG